MTPSREQIEHIDRGVSLLAGADEDPESPCIESTAQPIVDSTRNPLRGFTSVSQCLLVSLAAPGRHYTSIEGCPETLRYQWVTVSTRKPGNDPLPFISSAREFVQ